MRNLFGCRRGTVAFATVLAMIPLIGALALGVEAGSWYVTKKHAQNAADSAAMSGALTVVNSSDTGAFDSRGQLLGSLNGIASNVIVQRGTYNAGTFSADATGTAGNAVQAVATQCVQQSLTSLLVSLPASTTCSKGEVTIPATAIAMIYTPQTFPCVLALSGAISFQDAANGIDAPTCGLASNSTTTGFNFKVDPKKFNHGTLITSGACSPSGDPDCASVETYMPPITNPFAGLTNAMTKPSTLTLPSCSGSALVAYGSGNASTLCANNGITINNATTITTSGVYFFSGQLKFAGQGSLSTGLGVTATIILLPGATLSMTGGGTLNIKAPTSAPTGLPSQLSGVANLLQDMAFYDTETSPKIGGNAIFGGSGVFYLPNANPLNFQGTSGASAGTCTEVIAASIQFSGNPTIDNSTCPKAIKPQIQLVKLVQ